MTDELIQPDEITADFVPERRESVASIEIETEFAEPGIMLFSPVQPGGEQGIGIVPLATVLAGLGSSVIAIQSHGSEVILGRVLCWRGGHRWPHSGSGRRYPWWTTPSLESPRLFSLCLRSLFVGL